MKLEYQMSDLDGDIQYQVRELESGYNQRGLSRSDTPFRLKLRGRHF